jgi:hypothetical protein
MQKYNIEGDINFFDELYKSLDETNNEEDDDVCLITNQPLVEKFVELNCGHKFNYLPLYNDIYNHKQKFNSMESSLSSLKMNEIRCPYCRAKQTDVLPYYEELMLEKVNGVNFYDETVMVSSSYFKYMHYFAGKCEFGSTHDSEFIPKICNVIYVSKLDDKTYCCFHKNLIMNRKKKDIQLKEKEEKTKIKKELKQKEKEEKEEKKEKEKKKNKEENIIISSSIIINKDGCCQILKTGINKGNTCGLDILSDGLCKRHYNLKNK